MKLFLHKMFNFINFQLQYNHIKSNLNYTHTFRPINVEHPFRHKVPVELGGEI